MCLLKGTVIMPRCRLTGSGLVLMETPSDRGLMGTHAYLQDCGMTIPQH